MIKSRKDEQAYEPSIAPSGNRTTTTTGSTADTLGHGSATVVVNPGTVTDGTWTPSLTESDDSSSGFTDVAAEDLDGAFVALATGVPQLVGYTGSKRYLRVKISQSGASTGAMFAAGVLLADPSYAPV